MLESVPSSSRNANIVQAMDHGVNIKDQVNDLMEEDDINNIDEDDDINRLIQDTFYPINQLEDFDDIHDVPLLEKS